jgi:hypothetical protein
MHQISISVGGRDYLGAYRVDPVGVVVTSAYGSGQFRAGTNPKLAAQIALVGIVQAWLRSQIAGLGSAAAD